MAFSIRVGEIPLCREATLSLEETAPSPSSLFLRESQMKHSSCDGSFVASERQNSGISRGGSFGDQVLSGLAHLKEEDDDTAMSREAA